MLDITNLSVAYGKILALQGVSFHVEEGERVCIIGANGAGKSTTLRALSRLVDAQPGSRITYHGEDLLKYPADKVVTRLGISHVPEGRHIFGNLTVLENLTLAAFARKDAAGV